MRASPVKEGKLHLRRYLEGAGGELLAEVARTAGRSTDEVLGLIDEIRDLEIYLPVDEHRSQWRGGPDVIVATQLDDAAEVPFGVNPAVAVAGSTSARSPTGST